MSEIKTNKISSLDSSNSDITIEPDGTGDTIIASGNVGIGTSSPDQTLHVHKGSAGSVSSSTNSVLTLEDDGDVVLQMLCPSGNSQQVRFGDAADNGIGIIQYDHSDNSMRFNTNGPEKMRLTDEGQLFLGQTSAIAVERIGLSYPDNRRGIVVKNITSANGSDAMLFANTNGTVGTINTNGSSTSYNESSDYRLKENAVDMTGAITRVKSLQPKRFNFIADDSVTVDGFLAHEAQAVVPEAVTGTHNEVDGDGNPVYQGIDKSKLVPLLTGALQEAIAKIETLETENSTQATQIADLITRVTALENA